MSIDRENKVMVRSWWHVHFCILHDQHVDQTHKNVASQSRYKVSYRETDLVLKMSHKFNKVSQM